MSETLLWLLYLVSGLVAFGAVYRLGWKIVPAMLVGALVTIIGWALLYLLADEENRPDWITLDLSLNASFALIFASLGAAVAHFMLMRRREP